MLPMAVSASQFENGNAILEGVVMDKDDNDLKLEIHLFFEGHGRSRATGLEASRTTTVVPVNTDEWTMYTLNNDGFLRRGWTRRLAVRYVDPLQPPAGQPVLRFPTG